MEPTDFKSFVLRKIAADWVRQVRACRTEQEATELLTRLMQGLVDKVTDALLEEFGIDEETSMTGK